MVKSKNINTQDSQLSLFNNQIIPASNNFQDEEDYPEVDLDEFDDEGLDEKSDRTIEIKQELLTLKLMREAISAQNPNDPVMADFAEYVLPKLLPVVVGVTAKGGKFFDELDRQNEALGKEKVRRDNAADQSLGTHLLNGLFPANLIEQRLEKLNTTVRRKVREFERRLVIAGFILHDFEKFNYELFPEMPEKYKSAKREQDIRKLSLDEHREIILIFVVALGLDQFISNGSEQWKEYIDDLLCIAYNAQCRWDTNWNFSDFGLRNLSLDDRTLRCLTDLTCLADSLASIVKHPQDAIKTKFKELMHQLSDGQLRFTYHSISENRGVLTNVANNALMDAHIALNTAENQYYEPLLYLPTGVIYLTLRDAPPVQTEGLSDRVVAKIKKLCADQLRDRQVGFSRGNVGMKFADYYNLFFDFEEFLRFSVDVVINKIKSSKAPDKASNLATFQRKGFLSEDMKFDFKEDPRIDHLAELGALVVKQLWEDYLIKINNLRKADKNIPKPRELNLTLACLEFLGLEDWRSQVVELQELKNTGGIAYEWYFIAAKYLESEAGLGSLDVRDIGYRLVNYFIELTKPIREQYQLADPWQDLKDWCDRVVMLPSQEVEANVDQVDIFLKELDFYNAAKKSGRGKQAICSISHSPYTVTEQMESSVLFTPQVYTNKQMLGGSNAKRNISSIAGIEIMLRQILMNQTQAVGKSFEDGKYRYLYFYPTYYFTPETNKFLQKAYMNIAQTRFDTSLRNHFVSKDLQADFSSVNYQSADAFLLDDIGDRKDHTFKMKYPEDQPMTFYFMAMPPSRDATDTESWVMPSWLALAFPMILDVKTVVSESPVPPFIDGTEFEETVFLDSAPPAFRVLTGGDRFRLDYILDGWRDPTGGEHPAPLNKLTAAYAIHLDVNAKQSKGGYDANWGRLTELAKDFETSPLYVFAYLNKWVRNAKVDAPSIAKIQLYTYNFYPRFDAYAKHQPNSTNSIKLEIQEQSPLNHPQKLTELYRQFYRANKSYNPKANAVLKPIDVASSTILKADPSFQGEALVHVVAAEVCKLIDRVHASTAEGRWILKDREEERQKILEFANYFVKDVFTETFKGDRARLAGRQINLIRDTCEFLYRLAQDQENQERKAKGELTIDAEQEENDDD
ncbi:type I-D CRISPR-associated protein Cas10d/Csc3 [Pseudanabaena sp. FACHB-1277]|uniref:Type I-D CRISPR-associated protein Cas10d/Csc3 n=1 Tax=Pseudanabaena cinerea FACHB-1277 TaxID=2949581 RepID=A0A926URQ9_9CYAN|nr:type I-D CRISPR-associated protein Cas10d/Csc3 [Pseudanabaena cinerea]MBD2150011.1 type I-D CRISPR-associated protein Cas10d/Csc3 [Pseudanabaena cinerea FACHB-1277]